MTSNAIFQKLKEAFKNQKIETPEKGFKTINQWAKEFGCSRSYAKTLLLGKHTEGQIERRDYCIQNGKLNVKTPHYRLNLK